MVCSKQKSSISCVPNVWLVPSLLSTIASGNKHEKYDEVNECHEYVLSLVLLVFVN